VHQSLGDGVSSTSDGGSAGKSPLIPLSALSVATDVSPAKYESGNEKQSECLPKRDLFQPEYGRHGAVPQQLKDDHDNKKDNDDDWYGDEQSFHGGSPLLSISVALKYLPQRRPI